MNNEEKVKEMLECNRCPFRKGKDPENNCNTCFDKKFLLKMAQWKDEHLESKLMQIIILAQQGYTCGSTDEMILKQCKEIIKE